MPKNYDKVLKEVLKMIRPSKEQSERLKNLSKKVLDITNKEAKKVNAEAIIAGSLTRDTWLPDKNEFDIFIIFPKTLPVEKLEEWGLKLGKAIIKKLKGKWKIEYAQHPYVRGMVGNTQIDIVPCYKMEPGEKIKSAVDRTPFHVEYLDNHLSKELSDDVRLLKQFCNANKVYGADAKTEGFSGYVCELLVIKYGKFIDVLKNVTKWKPGDVIDIENYYTEKDHQKLRKQLKGQVLILIDPTDKMRNAAAAVSAESFFKLKKVTSEFLTKPSKELFFEKKFEPITEHELILTQIRRRTELLLVTFKPPKVVPDILWPQLRRFAERLEGILKEYEFDVLRKDVYTNEKDLALVLLEMQVSKLPSVDKRIGPIVFDLDDSERFIKKYKGHSVAGPFIEKNFWCVEVKRKFVTAREKLLDSLNEKEDILKEKGIPNYIAEQIAKKFDIISESDKIMKLVKKDNDFGVFMRKYFEKESLV
ncbi:MAG: CCA tRNA nucleotidyltransferase [Candidatus Aenigmarchaeota archaeon]|nr:CCA tRNA nucleotidyltransferase [Candidatus Aenigmarchaeota archaeon]